MKEHDEQQQERDPEVIDRETEAIARHPGIPVTITDLAALQEKGQRIIQFRSDILESLRKASIRMTKAQDWLLFRADVNGVEVVTGYLQDKGCARIIPLWGIEIHPTPFDGTNMYEKITDSETGDYAIQVKGWGFSNMTQTRTEEHIGIRYSTEDFCKDIQLKIKKESYVRLAARANLDGHIVREIAGLEGVPLDELKTCGLNTDLCARGKGFGSGRDRATTGKQQCEAVPLELEPKCQRCANGKPPKDTTMKYWPPKDGYSEGWSCNLHKPDKVWLTHSEVLKRVEEAKKKAETEGGEKK